MSTKNIIYYLWNLSNERPKIQTNQIWSKPKDLDIKGYLT